MALLFKAIFCFLYLLKQTIKNTLLNESTLALLQLYFRIKFKLF